MRFFHSIRWRLQLWHGLLLTLVLFGFGFTAWRLRRTDELRRIDQELELRIGVVVDATRPRGGNPGRPPPEAFPPPEPMEVRLPERDVRLFEGAADRTFYYIVWLPGGRELSRSTSAPPPMSCPERVAEPHRTRLRGSLRECFHFSPQGVCLLVGRDIHQELADMRRFGWLLAGAGGLVLLLGLTGGWWVSTRTLRPIADISATAASISSGDLTQRISTAESESELGQLAGVLNCTFARLDAAFAQQARFTADAAHELRTPVTVMLTHAQNGLDSQCDNEEHREAFEASQRAAQRMRRLIESLLTLARLDSGEAAATREPCDLDRVARDTTELLRPLAQEQNVSLEVKLMPTRCEGNEEQLGQVVTNLVSNAIFYNRPGGSVRVKVAAEANTAVLSVCDTGRGVSREGLSHIFERFYRADKARSNATGRTGLGLAITKAIVETHGGSIEVATELGKGSTFTVRLPGLSRRPGLIDKARPAQRQ